MYQIIHHSDTAAFELIQLHKNISSISDLLLPQYNITNLSDYFRNLEVAMSSDKCYRNCIEIENFLVFFSNFYNTIWLPKDQEHISKYTPVLISCMSHLLFTKNIYIGFQVAAE